MDKDQRDALYGPGARYSEHKEGEVIRFSEGGQEKQGKILHVRAPGQAIVGGREHPLLYVVDTGKGFPSKVFPSQVLGNDAKPQTFPVILASYGFKEHSLSREEAENLVANVVGQIIDNENVPRFKVLSARLEDIGEDCGKVIATCELVQEEQGEP
jgi:hypothetical protein